MANKSQVGVIGGLRKVLNLKPSTTTATTITGLEGTEVTLAQLAALIAASQKTPSNLIGDGSEAFIAVGPGLTGGGPVLGTVKIGQSIAPTPPNAYSLAEDAASQDESRIIPGPQGIRGLQGIQGPPGYDGTDAEEPLMIPGPAGINGTNGTNGINGYPVILQPEDPDEPLIVPGATGAIGPQGPAGTGGGSSASSVVLYQDSDWEEAPPRPVQTLVTLPVGANPTALVGLAAVNGSAATFMRSDGAPAIDQSISPTWTGNHQFNAPLIMNSNIVGTSTGFAYTISAAPNASFASSGYIQLFGSTSGNPYLVNLASNALTLQLTPSGASLTGSTGTQLTVTQTNANAGVLIKSTSTSYAPALYLVDPNTGNRTFGVRVGASPGLFDIADLTASVQRVTLDQNGAWIFNSAASGHSTVTINGVSGSYGLAVASTGGSGISSSIQTAGSAFAGTSPAGVQLNMIQGSNGTQSWVLYQPASSTDLRIYSSQDIMVLGASGNVKITGQNATNATALTVSGNSTSSPNTVVISDPSNAAGASIQFVGNGSTTPNKTFRVISGNLQLVNSGYTAAVMTFTDAGGLLINGQFACNGAASAAQLTGWGTPTNGVVTANYNGSTATLVQTTGAVAEIINILKQAGFFGA